MFQPNTVLVASALVAYITLAPVALMAQTSTNATAGTVSGMTTGNNSANRMAATYSAAFGTKDDARTAIEGMRAGKDVTQSGVSVSGTGATMGYGNIDIALSLAKARAGEEATTKDFLSALDQVMDMRASGMGWGQIAKDSGFNLGQVHGGSKSNRALSAKADAGKTNSLGRGVEGTGGAQGQGNGKGGSGGSNSGGGGNAGGGGNDGNGGNGGGGKK